MQYLDVHVVESSRPSNPATQPRYYTSCQNTIKNYSHVCNPGPCRSLCARASVRARKQSAGNVRGFLRALLHGDGGRCPAASNFVLLTRATACCAVRTSLRNKCQSRSYRVSDPRVGSRGLGSLGLRPGATSATSTSASGRLTLQGAFGIDPCRCTEIDNGGRW